VLCGKNIFDETRWLSTAYMSLCQDAIRGCNDFAFTELFPFTLVRHNCVWCFDLHVEGYGSCMVSTIGVGDGKFLGFEGFLPEFSQTCPKSFGRLCPQIFSLKDHEDLFWDDLRKRVFMCFSANIGHHFMKSIKVRAPFLSGFSEILPRFSRILPGFSIDQKSPLHTPLVSTEFLT